MLLIYEVKHIAVAEYADKDYSTKGYLDHINLYGQHQKLQVYLQHHLLQTTPDKHNFLAIKGLFRATSWHNPFFIKG